jgi:glucosamine-6-phosphate deaminase
MDFSLPALSEKNIFTGMIETNKPKIFILPDPVALGEAAGEAASILIKQAIHEKGKANLILATGTSQFETLNRLIAEPGIDWSKVTLFHLDEYIGLPITAEASFRKYLKERFIDKVAPLQAVYLINGEVDPAGECKRLGELIRQHPIDLALVGIGENGHLAFNDPPADFETNEPYLVVELDEACRKQQYNEGWFDQMKNVPKKAISMSVQQIMKSKQIICSVPDSRKAVAVRNSLEEPVSNLIPASILRNHQQCSFYLDKNAATMLTDAVKSAATT